MRQPPGFETTSRLVARALGVTPAQLHAGFRPADARDLDDVVAFRQRHSGNAARTNDSAYLAWRYRFGRPGCGMGEMYVLRREEHLLGIVGTEDMECALNGTRHNMVRTMDILVASEVQATGLGVWLNQAVFQQSAIAIAVGANRNSAGTVGRLFHAMAPLTEWRLQIDIDAYLRRRISSPALRAPLGVLFRSGLAVLRRAGGLFSGRALSLRAIERFDEETARLFATDVAGRVIVMRSPAYLNHRLLDNPRGRYTVTGAWRDGRLAGLVAWRVLRNGDAATAHVIDIRADQSRPGPVIKKLLLDLGCQAQAAGCSHVSLTMHAPQSEAALWASGFLAARHNQKIFGLYASDPVVMATLSSAVWPLTDLCDDNDGN